MALLPLVKGRKGLLLEHLHLEEGRDRPAVGAPSPWGRLGWGLSWNSIPLKTAGIGLQLELLPLGEGWDGASFVAPAPWRSGKGPHLDLEEPPTATL